MTEEPRKVSGGVEVNPGCLWIVLFAWLIYEIQRSADKIVVAITHIK